MVVMEFKVYRHVPPHLFIDEAIYFVSCRVYQGAPILSTDQKKEILFRTVLENIKAFDYELQAWVILDNHYHILFRVPDAKSIPLFFQKLHGKTGYELNKVDGTPGRRVWYNYWDECIRDERDYYNKLNYIHLNRVKHGYVENPEDYEFSSYRAHLKASGEDWLREILRKYPVESLLKNDV